MVLTFYEGARIARSIIGFKSEKHEVPSYRISSIKRPGRLFQISWIRGGRLFEGVGALNRGRALNIKRYID